MRRCATRDQVTKAMEGLSSYVNGFFIEELRSGTDGIWYACVHGVDGEILDAGASRDIRNAGAEAELGELGPMDELVTIGDADVLEIGRRTVRATGRRGALYLSLVRPENGSSMVIDVTQRL